MNVKTVRPARPLVSDVVRGAGVSAAELLAVAPELNVHTVKAVLRGVKPGTTQARLFATALRRLADTQQQDNKWSARACRRAATTLEAAYPDAPVPDAAEPTDKDALVIHLAKRKHSFASIGRRVGLTRQAVHQRVGTYEARTGETIPRCGTDY